MNHDEQGAGPAQPDGVHAEIRPDGAVPPPSAEEALAFAAAEVEVGESVETPDLIEPGRLAEIHGGGLIESVPGFDSSHAMRVSLEGKEAPADLDQLPGADEFEFEDDDLTEDVCDRDDRARINPTTSLPWRLICQLVIHRRGGGRSRGTGWLIGPRTVVTAGHCVFSRKPATAGWATSIEVYPALNLPAPLPFGGAHVPTANLRSVRPWTDEGKRSADYGAIILPTASALGSAVGWFGFGVLSDASLENLLVNHSGYPGSRHGKPAGTQWFNAGRIHGSTANRLSYMVDTEGGHSGGPVWRNDDDDRVVVGIHNYGGCPNRATRITQAVYDNLMLWKSEGS